jgi:hypothetical protein
LLAHTWNVAEDKNIYCTVQLPRANALPSDSKLILSANGKTLFTYSPDLDPLSMFTMSEIKPRLMTLWLSGSGAYRLVVFAYTGGKVTQVLDVGSKFLPEFAYSNNQNGSDDEQRIIIANTSWEIDASTGKSVLKPTSADVYRWDGKTYQVKEDVPWLERFSRD